MSKHTPGPWEAERDDDRELYDIGHRRVPVGQRCVATVTFGYDEPAESEQHANAKLIAAAPEMLDALQRILTEASVEEVNPDDCREFIIDVARTAIAKATT